MSYYFPFGNFSQTSVQNISYSFAATSGSRPEFANISIPTASYAPSSISTPPAGTNGISKTAGDCTSTAPTGPQGAVGVSGSAGPNISDCPAGSMPCPNLIPSLATVNANRASGSQFNIVCIETAGYIQSTVGCPGTLPTSSGYVFPLIPS